MPKVEEQAKIFNANDYEAHLFLGTTIIENRQKRNMRASISGENIELISMIVGLLEKEEALRDILFVAVDIYQKKNPL